MRLKDYGRNQKERKEYIHQSELLLAGVDVSKVKHDTCIGSLEAVRSKIGFRNAKKDADFTPVLKRLEWLVNL